MMKRWLVKHTSWLVALSMVLLLAVGVWAAKELSGQANSMSQQAGANSVDYEIATLDSLESPEHAEEKPEPPPCEWLTLRDLRHEIEANNETYKEAVAKAQKENETQGGVTKETRKKVLALAKDYKKANETMADLYEDCNAITKAKVHRDLAETRMKSAEVVVADEIEDDKLEELEESQAQVAQSHTEYADSVEEDETDLAQSDKERLNESVLPQMGSNLERFASFVDGAMALLEEAQDIASEAKGLGDTKNPLKAVSMLKKTAGDGMDLVKEIKALVKLAKGTKQHMTTVQENTQRMAQ